MYIADDDHVMRHVPFQKLLKDEDGNPIGGFLPQAFELKPEERGLSVNWVEYFSGSYQDQIKASVQKFRDTRTVRKSHAFGVANVKILQDTCDENGAKKVRVVLEEEDDNKSHSEIIRLPRDNLSLLEALATNAFTHYISNSEIK